jgi:hypothetical protein
MLPVLQFRTERSSGMVPALAPSGSVSWSTVLLPHAPILASACVHQFCAHPACGGTRKLSVPGRVHSVLKESWFVNSQLTSNPFLTRGTVESPLKALADASSQGKAADSNQSCKACTNPFTWLSAALPKTRAASYATFPLITCQAALASLQASAFVASTPHVRAAFRSNHRRL